MIGTSKVDIQVRLDEALKARLIERAKLENRSLGSLIAYAARVYLDGAPGQKEAA